MNWDVGITFGATCPTGVRFLTGIEKTNPWWRIDQAAGLPTTRRNAVVGENAIASAPTLKLGRRRCHTSTGRQENRRALNGCRSCWRPAARKTTPSSRRSRVRSVWRNSQDNIGKLYVSALTKPEDDFARRDPKTMNPDELERWSCASYVSSIAYSIKQVLPGSDVRVVRRVADGEGRILSRVQMLLWLVTLAALLAAALGCRSFVRRVRDRTPHRNRFDESTRRRLRNDRILAGRRTIAARSRRRRRRLRNRHSCSPASSARKFSASRRNRRCSCSP